MISGFMGWKFVVVESDLPVARAGLEGLVEYVVSNFGQDDLFEKMAYVFVTRKRNVFKCVYWDCDGFSIWHKRLKKGRFGHPKVVNSPISFSEFSLAIHGF